MKKTQVPPELISPVALPAKIAELQNQLHDSQFELEQSRQLQQVSLTQLEDVISSTTAAIARFQLWKNRHWKFIYLSPSHQRVFGYSPRELLDNKSLWLQGVHPSDRRTVIQPLFSKLFEAGQTKVQYRYQRSEGAEQWIEATFNSRRDHKSWIVTSFSEDITERKLTELTLQEFSERERLLRNIADRIRSSLDLNQMLTKTVTEIRKFLQVDRVLLFQIQPEVLGQGRVVKESVGKGWPKIMGRDLCDPCWDANYLETYRRGRVSRVCDVESPGFSVCYADFLRQFKVRANLAVPILQGEDLWGLLMAHQCNRPRDWATLDIELMQQLASQIGIGFQQATLHHQAQVELAERQRAEQELEQLNQNLEQQIQQRMVQLQKIAAMQQQQANQERILYGIAQQIRQSLNLEQILADTVREVRPALKADRAYIFKLTAENSGVIVKESVDPNYPITDAMNWEDECFPRHCYEFYHQGQPRIVQDVATDPWAECLAEFLQESQVKSKVVAPILQKLAEPLSSPEPLGELIPAGQPSGNTRIWGLLIVHACAEFRQWSPQEANLLQGLANQLGIAIQQADLYAQSKQELEERIRTEAILRQQTQQERLIRNLTQHIRQSLDLDQILTTAVSELRQTLRCDRVLVYQVYDNGTGETISESVGEGISRVLGRAYPEEVFPKTIHAEYLQGRVGVFNDRAHERVRPCLRDFMLEIEVQAKLVVPIVQQDTLWGLLIAHQCGAPHQWTDWEIELLQQIASQMAIAMQQANLYQRLADELGQREQAQASLQASLQEKEILLKEIHHRVKNNLQVVSSLLMLQAETTSDHHAMKLLQESQERVNAIALVHEHLYQSSNLIRINFADYLQNLVQQIVSSYQSVPHQLHLSLEPIALNLETALPCGLIINELVTNSLKHAFPKDQTGQLWVNFHRLGDSFVLIIRDDGVGLPPNFAPEKIPSLGLQLIRDLANQLRGRLEYTSPYSDTPANPGTRFKIVFSELNYRMRM